MLYILFNTNRITSQTHFRKLSVDVMLEGVSPFSCGSGFKFNCPAFIMKAPIICGREPTATTEEKKLSAERTTELNAKVNQVIFFSWHVPVHHWSLKL